MFAPSPSHSCGLWDMQSCTHPTPFSSFHFSLPCCGYLKSWICPIYVPSFPQPLLWVLWECTARYPSFIGRSCCKYCICRNKTHLLSRQKYACCDKSFCRDKIMFVTTKVLLQQAYFWQTCICRDKINPLGPRPAAATKSVATGSNCVKWS